MRVGVLALQGAVREHIGALKRCEADAVPIKRVEELKKLDGLLIPGGESTTIWKLIGKYGFEQEIREFYSSGKPIFGTCAGLILLANTVTGEEQKLGLIDIEVSRNAYGRQVDSFESDLDISGIEGGSFNGVFIRAPQIITAGSTVQVMAKCGDLIVMARNDGTMVSTFHPELTRDDRIHKYFINEMVKGG